MPSASLVKEFENLIGKENVFTSEADRQSYAYDAAVLPSVVPGLVLRPTSTEQLGALIERCYANGLPMTIRGAGTNLSGGTVPDADKSVVILTQGLNKIIEINEEDLFAIVEPGVVTAQFAAAVASKGLFYPPDPGSQAVSTIGGNIAENAGGLRGLKYGVTKDYVMGLEFYDHTGELVKSGSRTVKCATGYNLGGLLVGSEGTLGMISRAILKLVPPPQASKAMMAVFDNVTFEAAKPGLVLPEAAPYTGRLHIRPIGIPAVARREHPASYQMITKAIAGAFPEAAPGWHKGTAGAILIVGGSEGLTGAPHLAARAALRAGGGLISVAAPHGLCRDIKADCPDIMTRALGPAGNVRWSPALLEELLPFLRQCGAMVLGPGIGREPETAAFVQALLMCPSRPSAVVDADALHALAMHPEALSSLRACDVLTPHPGEAATLLHTTPALVQADRFAALAGLRRLAPSVWILKGAGTLIGTEGQPVTIAPYAEPNLAVGGSGDVLSGCLGTLMAQTAAHPSEGCESSSFLAACMGVHLHARAGRLLREAFPQRGNSATDIAEMLPRARIREAAGDGA